MEHPVVRWVVGIDGSPNAEHAMDWCLGAAPSRANVVHLVRAWQLPGMYGMEFGAQMVHDLEPETVHPELDRIATQAAALGVAVESDVSFGGASSVLLEAADVADLLILGSRGLGGFHRLLVGSVSHQCATHAHVPVVVIPDGARTDGVFERVVVGVDGTAGAERALAWAMDFVGDDVDLVAIGVFPTSTWTAGLDQTMLEHDMERFNEGFQAIVDRVERAADRVGVVRREFEHGSPAKILCAASTEADLVVVGERGHGGFNALLLGSVATTVLHRAVCPVAVIPGERAAEPD